MPAPASEPSLHRVSTRASNIAASATMALEDRVKALKAEGKPIISYGVGEPDFAPPEPLKQAAARAVVEDNSHYTTVGGSPALRDAIAQYTAEISGVPFAVGNALSTSGAKEALFIAFQVLCDPGDQVIIPAPYWVSYSEQAKLAGADVVIVQTDPKDWKLTPELLRQHITPKTRLLLLCSPSNPTGIVYSEAELRALADVIRETDAYVMVDEIYARISYVPVGRWLRAAPDLADRTLIVDGVSKAYAMTGWRLGWVVGPKDVIASCNALQSQLTSHPSAVSQQAALAALKHNPEVEKIVDNMVKTFHERRDAIVEALQGIPGLTCPSPDGAFYVYPDVRGLLGRPLGEQGFVAQSSKDVAAYLLDQTFTSTVPGEAFGTPGFLRLSYALGMEPLQEGCARIRKALA